MRGPLDLRLLFVAVSACHSGEPLDLAQVVGKVNEGELANGTPGCAAQAECSSGVCQTDVGGTARCCEADCRASGRVCSTAGECVCSSQQREVAGLCLLENGEPCRSAAECASEQCADGVCCDDACDGACERCDDPAQAGACTLHEEDASCLEKTGFECRARNRCRLPVSQVCGSAADCDSEHCAPGTRSDAPICCETACGGICQRCGPGGACDAYPAADPACPVLTCPSETPCREYRTPTAGECSGNGQCAGCEPLNTLATTPCGVGAQCDGDGECRLTGLGRVAAGANHTCAILDNGNVRCWGSNEYGQLGIPDDPDPLVAENLLVGDDEDPSDMPELDFGRDVVQVAAGLAYTCVLFDDGNVRCWGGLVGDGMSFDTVVGLLGTNDIARDARGFSKPLETGDVRLPEPAIQISAAGNGGHSCALLRSGKISCWGLNANGQCGSGLEGPNVGGESNEALPTVRLDARALNVSVGAVHTCALLEGGLVTCWGNGRLGRLGYGDNTDRNEPLGPVPIGEPVLQVTTGLANTCVLLEGGRVRCWGDNSDGQLGYGHDQTIGAEETPEQAAAMPGPPGRALLGGDVPLGGLGVVQISVVADARAVCALFASRAVRCWGHNVAGQLGYGHNETGATLYTPAELMLRNKAGDLDLGGTALALSIGGRCALLDTGALYCWGEDANAEIGLPRARQGSLVLAPVDMGAVRWE